jgi:type I restriction enzyme S subunit
MNGEPPKNWITIQLETLAANTKYPIGDGDHGQIKPAVYTDKGIPYIRVSDMGWGRYKPNGLVHIPESVHKLNLKSELHPGDVLIAKTGATIGKCFIVPDSMPKANTTSSVGKVTINRELTSPEWILFYFLSREFKSQMWAVSEKTAQPGFNIYNLKEFLIPLAPLAEQKRIVAKLEKLLNKVEASQKRLAIIPVFLKRFRQSILAAACSGRLTVDWREENQNVSNARDQIKEERFILSKAEDSLSELPKTWAWVSLGNYARCFRGKFTPRPRNDPRYFHGKHPFIQIGNLPREGGYITSHIQTLNDEGLAVSRKFSKGTVVIAIVGATIGNTGVLAYDMCVTDSLVGIETGEPEGNRYVEFFLRYKKQDIRQSSYSSGGQPNINLEFLNPHPLALPPFPEQQEIVRRVDALFHLVDKIEARYQKAGEQTDKLTQSILAKAFRGELVPQKPNDEPAEILLERLRVTKLS